MKIIKIFLQLMEMWSKSQVQSLVFTVATKLTIVQNNIAHNDSCLCSASVLGVHILKKTTTWMFRIVTIYIWTRLWRGGIVLENYIFVCSKIWVKLYFVTYHSYRKKYTLFIGGVCFSSEMQAFLWNLLLSNYGCA